MATPTTGTLRPTWQEMGSAYISSGHIFSINDWPYQATGIEGQGENAVLYFETPLRRPVTPDDEINLNATCLATP